MPRQASKKGSPWSPQELKQLKRMVVENTPTRVMALKLDRSEQSVRSKARGEGISLKPVNRSPYG